MPADVGAAVAASAAARADHERVKVRTANVYFSKRVLARTVADFPPKMQYSTTE